jgi:hypothetical protein
MLFGLFKNRDFTREWQRSHGLELKADIGEGSLCGVKLGRPVDHLCFLGPVDDAGALKLGDLCYRSLGLNAGFDGPDRLIDSFVMHLADPLGEGYCCFPGPLLFHGTYLKASRDSVIAAMGEPYWIDRDTDEELMFFEERDFEVQLEFDLPGQLRVVIATSKPLLADEVQRKAYGVTKPWPPGW